MSIWTPRPSDAQPEDAAPRPRDPHDPAPTGGRGPAPTGRPAPGPAAFRIALGRPGRRALLAWPGRTLGPAT
jgi:hypothetical protein